MAVKCRKTTVHFKTRKGIVSFPGHQGANCAPRKKPSSKHLKPWRDGMKKAAPQCARRGGGKRAYLACMKQALRSIHG